MSVPTTFKGIGSKTHENWENPECLEYASRKFNDEDILIKIQSCGVCGSDVHASAGNWGPYIGDLLIVGHEIVGKVEKVGSAVTSIQVGDIVGVGAASGSCGECKVCKTGSEHFCHKAIQTYFSVNYKADNYPTQGGYSSHIIVEENFVFPIPKDLPSDVAGPLLCGGLTVFSPLYRLLKGNSEGKTVGIVGIGGLGHLGIKFAKALGAKVVAFSRSDAKRADAFELGADEYVATGENEDWVAKYDREFDIIINCASSFTDIKYSNFLALVKIHGDFITVGAPAAAETLNIHPFQLIQSGASLSGSTIGSKEECLYMLDLCAREKIYPVIEKFPMSIESVKTVLSRVAKSDVKFRFVLTDIEEYFDKQ